MRFPGYVYLPRGVMIGSLNRPRLLLCFWLPFTTSPKIIFVMSKVLACTAILNSQNVVEVVRVGIELYGPIKENNNEKNAFRSDN